MTKIDFIPTSDSDFVAWHDNFKSVAQAKQAEIGLSAEDMALIEADNVELHAKLAAKTFAAAAHKQATAENNNTHDRVEANSRGIARRIKAQANYQSSVGTLFGIEGPDVSVDLASAKPHLSCVDLTGGVVEIRFNKLKSDGICLYCKREGDADWVPLAHPTVSPYLDNRPLLIADKPEIRRYTGVFMQKNQEIGQYSDEVLANCAP